MRALIVALATFAMALSPSVPLFAQTKPAGKLNATKLNEAKELFDQGVAAYGEGNYEAAIAAWEKSYAISERPLIWESIAHAYERMGNPRKAREYLVRWRQAAPQEEHSTLDTRLRNLDARIAREEETLAVSKVEEKEEQKERAAREDKEKRAAQDKAPRAKDASVRPLWPGFVLLGTGGASVIAGVTFDILAQAERRDAKQSCVSTDSGQICLTSARDAIRRSNTFAMVGDILWITGAAVAASGLVLVLTHEGAPKGDAARTTTLMAEVTPWSAGLVVEHRFY
jgi:tetratricopeptide (TPR) repeat protein